MNMCGAREATDKQMKEMSMVEGLHALSVARRHFTFGSHTSLDSKYGN